LLANWLDRIEQELREAEVVILMLSPQSVQRPWINFEGGAAWLAHKAVMRCASTVSQRVKCRSRIRAFRVWICPTTCITTSSVLHHLDPNASPPPPPYFNDYEDEEIKLHWKDDGGSSFASTSRRWTGE